MYAYCKSGYNEEASKLFDEMVNSGIVPDNVSYNTLVAEFSQSASLDKAVELPAISSVLTQSMYNVLVNSITTPRCQKEAASSE
jgi:pentatricopeptide repeat protein